MNQRTCTIEGCDRKHKGNGLCDMHRQRVRNTGTTDPPVLRTAEEKRETARLWSATHPELTAAKYRRYRDTHPWYVRSSNATMDARRRAPNAHVEYVDLEAVLTEHGLTCHICAGPISDAAAVEFDHVIPLAVGGDHIRANLRPSHKLCNVRKGSSLDASSNEQSGVAAC
jgi:5-methylcytosine-specific restriction endonuclease McrA